jgi:ATP-dependent helicase/nuclease subunit B
VVNTPRRHFLPWDRPLLPQAAAWLAAGWAGGAPLDLARVLVVVPTKQSGRRLREALAEHAAAHGQAVFPPRVVTPETLVAPDPAAGVASRLESLLAWADVLHTAGPDEFREVIPVEPPARDQAWALRLAPVLLRLQSTLAEAGLRLADVAGRAGADFPETERWRQLGALEEAFDGALAGRGLRDAQAAKIAAARGAGGDDFAQVVLLGTPDPLPLALGALAARGGERPVDVVVFAPTEEAANFDEWGRPLATAWEHRTLALPEFARRVQLCADPAAQAERLAALARGYGAPDGLLALGVADAEVLPLLGSELARAGVAAFNPEGRPRRGDPLYHLLAALAALAREPAFEAVEALARCPDFLAFLGVRRGPGFSAAKFLAALDDLRAKHLPADLAEARRHSGAPELELIAELHGALTTGVFPENAAAALGAIFAARRLDLAREADARLGDSAGAWTEVLRECAAARVRFPGLGEAEWWELALRLFGDGARAEEKPAGALELQGWLELLFEDAPHLAVAGFNDGRVPDAVVGDAFLPESLRARLGLKTNAARFARDAYLLQAAAACRSQGSAGVPPASAGAGRRDACATLGRLDLLFGKTSAAGDPLRPSRLLLQCADAELPARIALLFGAPELAAPNPPWTRAWRLVPRRVAPPAKVSVTSLKAWLACPFRFYLRTVLRMESVDPAKSELDAMDFGTLCHAALEAMGRNAALRDCTDAALLREFLLGELARQVRARFGANLTLPLVIQAESARQRLAQAAEVQARERAAGWVIADVERKFSVEIAGLTVSGKIDRIDRHAETGAVRLLDYKTSDKPVTPDGAHLRAPRRDETPPEWAVVIVEGKARVWQDLQLPLYRHALAAELGGDVGCGYFNLPRAVGDTGLARWEHFTPELQAGALAAAAGVCAAIRAGEFWPPSPRIDEERDEFAALFHRGEAESVEGRSLLAGDRSGAAVGEIACKQAPTVVATESGGEEAGGTPALR